MLPPIRISKKRGHLENTHVNIRMKIKMRVKIILSFTAENSLPMFTLRQNISVMLSIDTMLEFVVSVPLPQHRKRRCLSYPISQNQQSHSGTLRRQDNGSQDPIKNPASAIRPAARCRPSPEASLLIAGDASDQISNPPSQRRTL